MGGASRNEKKRRQDAAAQRLAAAGIQVPPKQAPNRTTIIVAAVLAVALVAGLAIWYFRSGSSATEAPKYTATQAGAVVTVGSGPVIVDVYEDYLCPICERFEERYGTDLTTALNNNQITVRYHSVAILDERTTPPGYSTRAGNAALCSVAAGIYPAYPQGVVRLPARRGKRRPDRRRTDQTGHRPQGPGRLRDLRERWRQRRRDPRRRRRRPRRPRRCRRTARSARRRWRSAGRRST